MTVTAKSKLFNALLILSSLFGYLAWGQGKHTFLFQVEAEIISKIFTDPLSVLHPFTVFPFLGQILLLATLFQRRPRKILTYTGIAGIGILMALIFFIGCLNFNFRIFISSIPFFTIAFFTIRFQRKK